jgi:hypothetical protein
LDKKTAPDGITARRVQKKGCEHPMCILPQDCNYSREAIFGASVEDWTLQQLTGLGYTARPLRLWTDRYDLLITGSTPD